MKLNGFKSVFIFSCFLFVGTVSFGHSCPTEPTPVSTPTLTPAPTIQQVPGEEEPRSEKLGVGGTKPKNKAIDVDPYIDAVEVNFNLLMDGSGYASNSSIEIKEKESDIKIATSYVEVSGKKVIFRLTPGSLMPNTEYQVRIFQKKVRAANAAGTTLEDDYVWTFTTGYEFTPIPTVTITVEPTPTEQPS